MGATGRGGGKSRTLFDLGFRQSGRGGTAGGAGQPARGGAATAAGQPGRGGATAGQSARGAAEPLRGGGGRSRVQGPPRKRPARGGRQQGGGGGWGGGGGGIKHGVGHYFPSSHENEMDILGIGGGHTKRQKAAYPKLAMDDILKAKFSSDLASILKIDVNTAREMFEDDGWNVDKTVAKLNNSKMDLTLVDDLD